MSTKTHENKPLMVQCDFDGTVTMGDLSFQILDEYTRVPWRQWFDDYTHGLMTVNEYNTRAFSNVKASKEELDKYSRTHVKMRDGLKELIDVCHENNIRFYFVSNGMTFYIETVIDMLGLRDIEYAAARTTFTDNGIQAIYYDPEDNPINDGFKLSYTKHFQEEGYRIVYIGNGLSDFKAARECDYIYAIEALEEECIKNNVPYKSFKDLSDIAKELPNLV